MSERVSAQSPSRRKGQEDPVAGAVNAVVTVESSTTVSTASAAAMCGWH